LDFFNKSDPRRGLRRTLPAYRGARAPGGRIVGIRAEVGRLQASGTETYGRGSGVHTLRCGLDQAISARRDRCTELKASSILLDGEGIVYDTNGMPNFALLHSREYDKEASLLAFDLLERDGDDVRKAAAVGAEEPAAMATGESPGRNRVQRPPGR
jgi:hypothetical protein